jgi:hypothetical protein
MNNKRDFWYGALLLGSLWGGAEALIGATMDGVSSPIPRSVVLALVAVMLLSAGRRLMPAMGTTLAIGIIAAGMKLLSMPSILACQFSAVIGQAIILEVLFSASERLQFTERRLPLSVGIVAASYLNSLTFAFSQAYLFQNHWWLDRGVSGLLEWSFVTGSGAALASWIGFTLGCYLGRRLNLVTQFPAIRSAYLRGASVAISGAIWFAVVS